MAIYNRNMGYHLTWEDESDLARNSSVPRKDLRVISDVRKTQLAKECYAKNQRIHAEERTSRPEGYGADMYSAFVRAESAEGDLIRKLSPETLKAIRNLKESQGLKSTDMISYLR